MVHRFGGEADEMWSCVGKEANQPGIWIAMDAKTRQVMALHIGDRSRESGYQLWANTPAIQR